METELGPKVSIILLNYNGHEDTNTCLDSIRELQFDEYEVIVVDNGSEGDPKENITTIPNMELHCLEKNVGFSNGCNYAASHANGKYLLFLNNDAEINTSAIEKLVGKIESDPETAAVVPQVRFDHDRSLIDKGYGLYDNLGFSWFPNHVKSAEAKSVPQDSCSTPWGCGCALLVQRSIFEELDGFDEDFFMYTDDLELSIRLRKAGYDIKYVPSAVVYHKYARGVRDGLNLDRNPFQLHHVHRNRAKVLTKHYPLTVLVRSIHLIVASFLYWGAIIAAKGEPRRSLRYLADVFRFARMGLSERDTGNSERWTQFMRYQSLRNYLQLALNRKKFYEGDVEVPETGDVRSRKEQ